MSIKECLFSFISIVFSSPERSLGRAVALSPASASASALASALAKGFKFYVKVFM